MLEESDIFMSKVGLIMESPTERSKYKELNTIFLLKLFREDARFESVPIIILCESVDDELIKRAEENSATIVSPKTTLPELAPVIFQKIMDYWMTTQKDLYVYKS